MSQEEVSLIKKYLLMKRSSNKKYAPNKIHPFVGKIEKNENPYDGAVREINLITGGSVTLDGIDVLEMSVDERAKAGLFLAMQYPVEVPGVSVSNFLRTAVTAIRGEAPKVRTWVGEVKEAMASLNIDTAFSERNVNEGFSGGEKKRHEILQMELLRPKIAILDETDSGLDVDALRIVSEGVNRVKANSDLGVMLITHYTRILRYIKPDFVHVFANGKIVEAGGPELADKLEEQGYAAYITA